MLSLLLSRARLLWLEFISGYISLFKGGEILDFLRDSTPCLCIFNGLWRKIFSSAVKKHSDVL